MWRLTHGGERREARSLKRVVRPRPIDLTALRDGQRREQLRNEAAEIRDAVRWRTQDDDGDGEARQVLLKREITVDRAEGLELLLRSPQQFAIFQCSPAGVWHRLHVVSLDVARQTSINALVEEHPHDACEIIRAVASSRKATTCSRLTVGNPARKSSIVSPPSR